MAVGAKHEMMACDRCIDRCCKLQVGTRAIGSDEVVRGKIVGCSRMKAVIGLHFGKETAMAASTPAMIALSRAGLSFELLRYDYDPSATRIGLHAAQALGELAGRLLKTLIIEVDGKPACVLMPSDRELSLKGAAAAFSGKSARLATPATAERLTGYKIGGVSPFGQRRHLPTAIEITVMTQPYLLVNGGGRGLQLRVSPATIIAATGAIITALV